MKLVTAKATNDSHTDVPAIAVFNLASSSSKWMLHEEI